MTANSLITKDQPLREESAPPAVVTPSQILAQAFEKGASIEQLTQLLELQDRFYAQQEKQERRESERQFNLALSEFKANAPKIIKDKQVRFGDTSYDHASLANVVYTITDRLSEYGLSSRWETEQDNGIIKVTCILSHKLGHEARVTLSSLPDTSGKKNSIQAIGSAVSYLQRYTLLAITGLATQDQDDDGAGAAGKSLYISFEQSQEIDRLVKENGGDLQKLVEHFGVSSVSELPADRYNSIITTIKAKAAKAGVK